MLIRKMLLSTTSFVVALGFDNNTWATNDDGSLKTDNDGNPIYIDANGQEKPLAPGYVSRINSEAAQHRQSAADLKKKLEAFGDLDPKSAKEAIAKMKDVNFDDLVNKGEIEQVRSQITQQMQAEIDAREARLTDAQNRIEKLALDNAFNSSTFLKERVAFPEDVVRATFRNRFEYDADQDRVVPKTSDGNNLLNKHGDIASVDEAFETFITARADKDQWLKAPDASGSGSQGGGGGRGGGNVMKRADFDALGGMDKAAIGQKVAKGEMKIVD